MDTVSMLWGLVVVLGVVGVVLYIKLKKVKKSLELSNTNSRHYYDSFVKVSGKLGTSEKTLAEVIKQRDDFSKEIEEFKSTKEAQKNVQVKTRTGNKKPRN